jgi:hypothetical protein
LSAHLSLYPDNFLCVDMGRPGLEVFQALLCQGVIVRPRRDSKPVVPLPLPVIAAGAPLLQVGL